METEMEGATAKIYAYQAAGLPEMVEKRYKAKRSQKNVDLEREKQYHADVYDIWSKEMRGLGIKVPFLFKDAPAHDRHRYIMEKVDSSQPMYDEDWWAGLDPSKQKDLEWRVRIFVKAMAAHGIFLRDVEGFYDAATDLINFLDFGQVYRADPTQIFRLESGSMLPGSVTMRIIGSDRVNWVKHQDVPGSAEALAAGGGGGS
jgi:hypothetical protein